MNPLNLTQQVNQFRFLIGGKRPRRVFNHEFAQTQFIVAAALLLAVGAHAPADGGPAPTGPTQPLRDGTAWLLADGISYAVHRLRQRHANL